jgi:hypothetical protein
MPSPLSALTAASGALGWLEQEARIKAASRMLESLGMIPPGMKIQQEG